MNSKRQGEQPLNGRMPAHAEWRLLERLALDVASFIDSNDLKVIREICQKRDLKTYLLLDEYWGLHSIDPRYQVTGTRDACLYQLASFLKKNSWSNEITEAQKNAALMKFYSYESRMRDFNRNGYRELTWADNELTNNYVTRMQEFIASVLGTFSFSKVTRYADHGPGGTFGLNSQNGHRYYKYASVPYEVTSDAVIHARRFIKQDPRWLRALTEHPPYGTPVGVLADNDSLFRVVPGNRIEFVPKNTDEARTIALEPAMNVMLQLGIDGHIRKNLKKKGIDINDQETNQILACLGSIDNSLSTLDLKGASDNVSIVIIEKLFPHDWARYMLDIRSDVGNLPDGTVVQYEKLSSMGNGYTFAVETLLFAAAVYAINPCVAFGEFEHVYGDDIIVKAEHVPELIRLLNLCGFLVNDEKSFTKDTFTRESCGADFFQGENIRPVFLKEPLEQLDVFAFYSIHNRLAEWFSRTLYDKDPQCLSLLKRWCKPGWLLYGPPNHEEQSAYLSVPHAPYGVTSSGSYRFDRAIAVAVQFEPRSDTYEFHALCHDLSGDLSESMGGSRYTITRRSAYAIRKKRRSGRCFAWPEHSFAT